MRNGDAIATLLAVTSILSGPVFDNAVGMLRSLMLVQAGYDRPTTGRLQGAMEKQGIPAMPHAEDLLVSESQFIKPHVAAALTLESPIAEGRFTAASDLVGAVKYLASFRGDPAALALDRGRRRKVHDDVGMMLTGLDRRLEVLRTPASRRLVAAGASLALTAAYMRAMAYPDFMFTVCQLIGFPCVGKYKDTGIFRLKRRPATQCFPIMKHQIQIDRVEANLRAQAARATPTMLDEFAQITAKTRGAVMKGFEKGPFTKEQVDAQLGSGCWRPLQAFAVLARI